VLNMLNDQLKSELQQTRDRLLNEQKTIAQTATAEAEAEIDRVLEYINQILGDESSAPTSSPAPAKTRSTTAAPKSVAPKSASGKAFDATVLKSKFKQIKAMDAIVQVLEAEKKPLSIDDLISELYDPFEQAEIARARRSVAITAKHAERRGLIQRASDNPPQYEAN
jgi:hypothetical protein